MKKLLLYIIPLLTLITACNELDKYPLDSVSSEVYFKNESQLEQYSNQFYTIFPGAAAMYNEASDEIAITELADEVRGTRILPTDASGTNWNWSMLRRINYLLEHLHQCPDVTIRDQYKGLAFFFRAYLYYDRVRHYGDVPWLDRTIGNNEAVEYARRVGRDTIMSYIIQDLDSAFILLPKDKSNVYRVNCWAAMALKSRACLFEGTFCKYHPELFKVADKSAYAKYMLNQAVQAAEVVMDQGGYKLYQGKGTTSAYRDLFTQGKVQGMDEYILARCYSLDVQQNHNVNYFTMVTTTGHPGFTKRFVNQYLCSDGTRFTDKYKANDKYATMNMADEMKNRDPRMKQTIFCPGEYVRVGKTEPENYSLGSSCTGYQLIKYVMDEAHDTYNNSDCDMPLFRYAEVLLNYAEAKAELGEFTPTESAKSIDLIRARVGMKAMDVTTVSSSPCWYMTQLYPNIKLTDANQGIILEIRRERNIELIQEGFHYWDLMRWREGKAFEQPYLGTSFKGVSKTRDDKSGIAYFDSKHKYAACVWTGDHPFAVNVLFLELNKDIVLYDPAHPEKGGTEGGFILCDGTLADPTGSRKWREERDYLYPIPTRERILSGGRLTQNPGWEVNM